MTSHNGQPPADPNGASRQATSTVLPLDGWGPLTNNHAPHSVNGAGSVPPAPPSAQTRTPSFDTQLIRTLAPALVMTLAALAVLGLAAAWRRRQQSAQTTSKPVKSPARHKQSRQSKRTKQSKKSEQPGLRRRLAVAIDPSLGSDRSPSFIAEASARLVGPRRQS